MEEMGLSEIQYRLTKSRAKASFAMRVRGRLNGSRWPEGPARTPACAGSARSRPSGA
jgi:hypothetical protein